MLYEIPLTEKLYTGKQIVEAVLLSIRDRDDRFKMMSRLIEMPSALDQDFKPKKELIPREAAIRALCDGCVDDGHCGDNAFDGRYSCEDVPKLLKIPAAVISYTPTGEWLKQYPDDPNCGLVKCSVCGYEYCDYIECAKFCGNCGAMMGGTP